MFKFGSKKQAVSPDTLKEQPSKRLVVQLGTMGWVAGMQDGDGVAIGQPVRGEVAKLESMGQERIEKIIHQMVEEIGHSLLKEAEAVSVLVEGIGVVFSDSKQEGLRAASDATARMYGQRMLNAPTTQAVTFGQAPFGPDPERGPQQEPESNDDAQTTSRRPLVYAFADVRQVRSLLSLFDIAALKVTSLTPTIYPILRKAALQPDQTYGAILLGSHETTIILGHHNLHGILVRTSPVGVFSLAQSVSEKAGISIADALENLSKRDLVAKITPDPAAGDKGLTTNPYQAGLEPGLRQLLQDIQESLEFFMAQRVCGKPLQLECFGELGRINGLERWLTKLLQLEIITAEKQPLQLFSQMCQTDDCNLLRGAETSLISVGKVKYSFSKTGFVKTSTLATQTQGVTSVKSGAGRLRGGGRPGGRRGRPQDKPEVVGFLPTLLAKLRGVAVADDVTAVAGEAAEESSAALRNGAVVLLTLAGLLLYWGYDQYLLQKKHHSARVGAYLKAREVNTSSLKATGGGPGSLAGAAENLQKLFWTEKFMAISQAMNQHIWLTDLYLTSAQMELAGAKVETKKLVMEGAVLPSWDGHIGRMSEFLASLSDQEKNPFMNDFRQITFRGASLDSHDDIVRFGFEAWYDRNKRVDDNKKKLVPGDMSGNLNAIQESTAAKENALRPKLK